jgi:hypothetical protein
VSKAFAGGGGDRVDPPAPAVAVPNICDDFDLYYVVPKPSSVSHGVSYLLQEFGILLADTLKIPRDSYAVEGAVFKEFFFDERTKTAYTSRSLPRQSSVASRQSPFSWSSSAQIDNTLVWSGGGGLALYKPYFFGIQSLMDASRAALSLTNVSKCGIAFLDLVSVQSGYSSQTTKHQQSELFFEKKSRGSCAIWRIR